MEELPTGRTEVMKLLSIALVCCSLYFVSCSSDTASGEYDEQELIALRQEKDAQFRDSDDSPIPGAKRSSFKGLAYFPPNAEYAVSAQFTESSRADTITMPTSKDDLRKAVRIGTFSFAVNGKDCKLAAYTFVGQLDENSYFVPFTDLTSGHETYYAGRYLDVPIQEDEDYVLDFNVAYNPYCAYNENYSCPLVPRENNLSVAIRAGEKK